MSWKDRALIRFPRFQEAIDLESAKLTLSNGPRYKVAVFDDLLREQMPQWAQTNSPSD